MKIVRTLALLAIMLTVAGPLWAQSSSDEPAQAPLPPAHLQPEGSDSDFWRSIRQGNPGQVSIPNAGAGLMIQSEGDNWRNLKNGQYRDYSAYILLGMFGLLCLFYVLRGRIRIAKGRSDRTITRFTGFERFAHWLTAVSFIILALTGLNLIFGRSLLGLLGEESGKALYAQATMIGKLLHNTTGFAFMVGIALMFILWVRHNIPAPRDLVWLLKGGGILGGAHPPAKKFNAGQKIVFWLVILGGGSLAASGIALIYPFEFQLFAPSFHTINQWFGVDLPTEFGEIQEMQLATLWHGIVAVVMIAVILAHIYIGSVGMEGAFDAMGTGEVDSNWARDHHSLWVEELEQKRPEATPGE